MKPILASSDTSSAPSELRERKVWLDLVRGASALAVCAGHIRAGLFVDFGAIAAPNVFDRAFYFCTGLGREAVMVFFVLSGFFVGGGVLAKAAQFRWSGYLVARLSRLWLVLVPSLLLTLAIDLVLRRIAPEIVRGDYYPLWNSGPNGTWSIAPTTFVANVFFLQTILAPVYGSNTPLWSLANEFWYYILFPMATVALQSTRPILGRVVIALLVMGLCFCLLPSGITGLMPVWLVGVLAWWLAGRTVSPHIDRIWLFFGLLMTCVVLAGAKTSFLRGQPTMIVDYCLGLAFASAVVPLARLHVSSRLEGAARRFTQWLANMSYSLYLCHLPAVLAISYLVVRRTQLQPCVRTYLIYASALAAQLLLGWLVWFLFERHTERIRQSIQRICSRRQQRRTYGGLPA